jgi:hypothetical protein
VGAQLAQQVLQQAQHGSTATGRDQQFKVLDVRPIFD